MLTLADAGLTFNAEQHVYTLHGIRVPSVTQVLKQIGYIRLDGIPPATLEAARDRGSRVHQALHYLIEDDLDEGTVGEDIAGYMASARAWLDAEVTEVVAVEARLSSKRFSYAGTVDLLAVHADGLLSVDDFKTGDPADVAADLQTAAYMQAILEAGTRLKTSTRVQRRSVRLHRDGRPATETLYTDYQDWPRFMRALSVVHDLVVRPAQPAWDEDR